MPMPKKSQSLGVLCDTGFLIRLNNPNEPLHTNARGYLKYFLDEGHLIYISTIALAEYAVRDRIENLPMRYFRVLPFNIDHAQRAGEFTEIVLKKRAQLPAEITKRTIIPNDSKMFAQAAVERGITHFLTSDKKCEAVYRVLKTETDTNFDFLNLHESYHTSFGILKLEAESTETD